MHKNKQTNVYIYIHISFIYIHVYIYIYDCTSFFYSKQPSTLWMTIVLQTKDHKVWRLTSAACTLYLRCGSNHQPHGGQKCSIQQRESNSMRDITYTVICTYVDLNVDLLIVALPQCFVYFLVQRVFRSWKL